MKLKSKEVKTDTKNKMKSLIQNIVRLLFLFTSSPQYQFHFFLISVELTLKAQIMTFLFLCSTSLSTLKPNFSWSIL